jgi:signal transduction histidine kinase/HPt (histidine-containing phosphotransfer) domain-containing protein/ActR/RegA family two-component response regulator
VTEASQPDTVSRKRYQRERKAREEAERLLEDKSRQLFLANEKLSSYANDLEQQVSERTKELSEALARAEAAITARARFIATMSHEIRTPLSGMLGIVDILVTDETDTEKRQLLEYAKASGESLRTIVNDVLDFSRIDAGSMHLEREPVDLRSIIVGLLELAKGQLGDDVNRLSMTIDTDVPERFWGDATRIRQVISNLLSNAIRYSETGPIEATASVIKTSTGTMRLTVGIEDSGIGIPEAEKTRLFKDFSQVQNPLTKAAQGAGLGLALCKRIVEKIGGNIHFHSVLGQGSRFWFEIPIDVVGLVDRKATKKSPSLATSLVGTRVLLAEDNKINQKVLGTFLSRMGCIVTITSNGQEALDAFAVGKFDVVLMDLAMPIMDGFTAVKALQRIWNIADLPPVAFLTAHVVQSLDDIGEDVIVDAYLTKPITYNELQTSICDLLDNARGKDAQANADWQSEYKDGIIPEFEDVRALIKLISPEVAAGIVVGLDKATLLNLVEDLVNSVTEALVKLRAYKRAGRLDAITHQAHALKGASALLGFRSVAQILSMLEYHNEAYSAQEFEHQLKRLESEIDKIRQALKVDQ